MNFLYSNLALAHLELEPKNFCDQNLEYEFYSLCYSEEHKQAAWTYHLLTKESIKGRQKRTNNFREDPQALVIVKKRDYQKTGYDRGHLVPAADMKLNFQSMSDTFYMTNMSPQNPSFNRGVWSSLEYGFRKAVLKYGDALVVTGPLLEPGLKKLKKGISVPEYFYKVAYFPESEFMMAFLLPNKNLKGQKYRDFSLSVNELEEILNIDFFSDLPDDLEDLLEDEVF